jgi:S-adenosylmethionine hydrolase
MPVAARLAAGTPLDAAGAPVDVTSLVTLPRPDCRLTGGAAHLEVVTADRFGNLQLSLRGADAPLAGLVTGALVTIAWDGGEVTAPFVRAFGDVEPAEVLCYLDSGDWVAIAVSGGDAARRLGLRAGAKLTLTAQEPR